MAVRVQVLDEKGLPVFCTVAAVRTADQTILSLTDTNSEGVAVIAENGTWYPRPMVSPNYKSRIRILILNGQNAPCYDYVVDTGGGGTHDTLEEAWAAAKAAGGSKTIWLCGNALLATALDMSGMDDSHIAIHGPVAHDPYGNLVTTTARYYIDAPSSEPIFRASTGASSQNSIQIRGLGLVWDGGEGLVEVTGSAGTTLYNLDLEECSLSGSDIILVTDIINMPTNLRIRRCAGSVRYSFNNTALAGSGPDVIEIADSRDLQFEKIWNDSPETSFIYGGRIIVTSNTDVSGASKITARGLTIDTSATIFTSDGVAQNTQRLTFDSITVRSTGPGAEFCDLQAPGVNPGGNIFIHGIHGVIHTGVTPTGTFVEIDSAFANVYVADIHAPDWPTLYTGPTTGFAQEGHVIRENGTDQTQRDAFNIVDSDAGVNLVQDDAANNETELHLDLYALLTGRAGGQTLRGGTASGEDLFLQSTADATKGDIYFEDTNFGVAISSSNPRIFFDGAADRLAYDRTNNRLVVVIGNTEEWRVVSGGMLNVGYARVGSLSAPGNVTAGDFTATRVFINNDSNFSLQVVSSNPRLLLESGTYLQWDRTADDLHFVTLGSLAWSQAWSGGALGDQAMTWKKHGQSAEQQLWQFDLVPQTNQSANFRVGRTTDVGTGTFSFEVFKGNNSTSAAFTVATTNAGTPQVRSFGDMLIDNFLEMTEISAPSTPAANKLRVYVKDKAGVSALYFKKDDGTEVEVGSGGGGGNTEIRLDAQELYPAVTDGCEYPAPVPFSTNNKRFVGARFVVTGTRYAEGEVILPADYAGGTITAKIMWWALTAGSGGADTVRWTVALSAHGDDDALDSAWGTGVSVDDALDGSFTANEMRISAATAAITPSGTPAAGEKLKVRIYREPTHANDTYAGTAVLAGIILDY